MCGCAFSCKSKLLSVVAASSVEAGHISQAQAAVHEFVLKHFGSVRLEMNLN